MIYRTMQAREASALDTAVTTMLTEGWLLVGAPYVMPIHRVQRPTTTWDSTEYAAGWYCQALIYPGDPAVPTPWYWHAGGSTAPLTPSS